MAMRDAERADESNTTTNQPRHRSAAPGTLTQPPSKRQATQNPTEGRPSRSPHRGALPLSLHREAPSRSPHRGALP